MNKFKKLDNDFEKVQQSHFFMPYEFINKAQSFQFAEFTASTFFSSHYNKFTMVYTK